jgi:methionyl-tRNA synthetase
MELPLLNGPHTGLIIILILLWTIPWKGVALWKSARSGQAAWFVVLLIVNTLAILEILYIFIFSKRRQAGGRIDRL